MRFVNGKQRGFILTAGLLILSILFLQGCGDARKGITIDSNPQGADIIADGKHIGKTPLQIKQDSVFPPHWYGGSYMVKGQLEIKKEGCEMVKMEVNDQILATDIKKDLECKAMMKPAQAVATPAIAATPAPSAQPEPEKAMSSEKHSPAPAPDVTSDQKNAMSGEIESRLNRLKGLRDRKVINEKEYQEQRQRILNSL